MYICHVPNTHLSVEGITSRQKKAVVVREGQVLNPVVMLAQPVNGQFLNVIPDDDV